MKRGVLAVAVALLAGALPSGVLAAGPVHRATLPGVTLLAPVANEPLPTAAIDPDVDLRIEIFALVADRAVGSPIGPSFARSGRGTKPVKLHGPTDVRTDHYHADWATKQSKQPNGAIVRVELRLPSAVAGPACNAGVSLDGGCIGYFDVQLQKAKKGTAPEGVLAFQNGKTLPIRIHIEDGALDPPPPDDGDQLPGDPDAPATSAIPQMKFEYDADDYAQHPGMGGLIVSFDVLYLAFAPDVTVTEANALLEDIGAEIIGGRPGEPGASAGFLLLRVPTKSHAEMDVLIDRLRLDPRVLVAVQDSLLETSELPKSGPAPGAWVWGVPNGDNWGLEAIRAPQMWNLNNAVEKQGRTNTVGVFDGGFYDHRDLSYDTKLTPLGVGDDLDHGTHVAGTIAADYDNEYGVEGVDPYARLVVDVYNDDKGGWGLYEFIENAPDLQVVNVSLGNNWYQHPPKTDAEALEQREMIMGQAVIFELWQVQFLAKGRPLPLIVAAAGNDSNSAAFQYDIGAEWSSPWNYAAIKDGVDNVIVVEAVGLDPTGTSMSRASFSNIHGQISAPGVDICSTATPKLRDLTWPDIACGGQIDEEPEPFMLDSGTSMAAPHVAGLAGYLSSLDPTLTPQELRKLLIENGVAATGTPSPVIDGFASALAIDGLRNDSKILRGLVDIDDGTVDGNLRLDCSASCSAVTGDDADSDRGRGDGSIDMSDFRRWRDWFLLATEATGLALDGDPSSPKNDVNRDGFFSTGGFENVYPAGDFNGDGKLDEHATKLVPGHLNLEATDLGVLQSVFSDPDVPATRLPGLIRSVDLHVNPSGCIGTGDIGAVTKIIDAESGQWIEGDFERGPTWREYTMPFLPGGYSVRVEALNANGDVTRVAQTSFAAPLGSDSWYAPTSCGLVTLSPTRGLAVRLEKGESTTQTAQLTSSGLDTDWEFTTSVANVETSVEGGHLASGGDTTIGVTITCPDKTGPYGGYLNLLFTDATGHAITKGVPDWLPVDIVCHNGGVTVDSSILGMRANPGQTVTKTFTLTNSGAALRYEATPGDHVAVDPAEGELAALGEATITVTATCPQQGGDYISTIGLSFERVDGKTVTDAIPTSVEVDLSCDRLTPFRFIEQLHSNEVDLARPDQHVLNRFHSITGNGTGNYYDEENHVVVDDENVAWNGFGTQFSRINLSDSADLCPGCADPQTRTRSASSNRNFEATIGAPNVTFTGDFSQSYTQTRLVAGNLDTVSVYTSMDFELNEQAQVDGSWTCSGGCTISLQAACDGCGSTFDSHATGSFSGSLAPGRYVFVVTNTLPTTGSALSVSAQATYTLRFTFAE